jgi:hypothetical protein
MHVKIWGLIPLLSGPLGPYPEWEATGNKLLAICEQITMSDHENIYI